MKRLNTSSIILNKNFKYGLEIECGSDSSHMCENCHTEWNDVCEDHRHKRIYHKDLLKKEFKKLKLNLSCNRIKNKNYYKSSKDWNMGQDGSIRFQSQVEIRSPVLKGEKDLQKLKNALASIINAKSKVNKSCGLHVHIDCNYFTLDQLKSFITFFILFEKQIDNFFTKDRQRNIYARSIVRSMFDNGDDSEFFRYEAKDMHKAIKKLSDQKLIDTFSDHYSRVNLMNYNSIGTVEFRQHHGSISFDEISNWIKTIYVISEECKEVDYTSFKLYDKEVMSYTLLQQILDKRMQKLKTNSSYIPKTKGQKNGKLIRACEE